jgi:Protein of unknown function (DUF2892).
MNTTTSMPATGGGTNVDRLVFRFAGVVVLGSLLLAHYVSPYWLWLTAFVGFNLLQSSFTSFCPLAMILHKLGVRSGAAFCASSR